MGTLTHGKVIYYDPKCDTLDGVIEKALHYFPSESAFIFRSNSKKQTIKKADLTGKIVQHTHRLTQIVKNFGEGEEKYQRTVPDMVRLTLEDKDEEDKVDAIELKNNRFYIKQWRQYMAHISQGKLESYNYGINLDNTDYVEELDFQGIFDIREYHGILMDVYNPEEVAKKREEFLGTLIPTVYVGRPGDAFPWHLEDAYWSSLNASIEGDKLWLLPASRHESGRIFKLLNTWAGDTCPNPQNRKVFFCNPEKLLGYGVNLKYLIQTKHDIVYTLPFGAHAGISLSYTVGIAKNCADKKDWAAVALEMKNFINCTDECKEKYEDHLSPVDVEGILNDTLSYMELEKIQLGESPFSIRWSLNPPQAMKQEKPKNKEEENKIKCPDCMQSFSSPGNLTRHLEKSAINMCKNVPLGCIEMKPHMFPVTSKRPQKKQKARKTSGKGNEKDTKKSRLQ